MPLWTLFGLRAGRATTTWPGDGGDDGQTDVFGMPRFDPGQCLAGCRECVDACMTGAITATDAEGEAAIAIDYGRCVACRMCVDTCPTDALTDSGEWAFGVRERRDLRTDSAGHDDEPGERLRAGIRRAFGRSLYIRHMDAGSCNGCESELQALNNPFYNLHRLGIFFTASPRHADVLLVTGSATYALRDALRATYEAMPEPRWVLASGSCAVSGGVAAGTYAGGRGADELVPVDVYLPGCPPNPAALIHALLLLVERAEQRVHAGRPA